MLPDIIAIAAIALVVGAAVFYIVKAKKSGRKCIGCPDSKSCTSCSGSCSSCSSCCGFSAPEEADREDKL